MRLIQRLHPPRACSASGALSLAQTLTLCLSALCVLIATYSSLEHSQRAATLHRRSLRRAAGFNPTGEAVRYSAASSLGGNSNSSSSGGGGSSSIGSSAGAGRDGSGNVSADSVSEVAEADSAALAVCLVTKVEADDPQWRDGVAQDLVEVWNPAAPLSQLLALCMRRQCSHSLTVVSLLPVQHEGTGEAV